MDHIALYKVSGSETKEVQYQEQGSRCFEQSRLVGGKYPQRPARSHGQKYDQQQKQAAGHGGPGAQTQGEQAGHQMAETLFASFQKNKAIQKVEQVNHPHQIMRALYHHAVCIAQYFGVAIRTEQKQNGDKAQSRGTVNAA